MKHCHSHHSLEGTKERHSSFHGKVQSPAQVKATLKVGKAGLCTAHPPAHLEALPTVSERLVHRKALGGPVSHAPSPVMLCWEDGREQRQVSIH